MSRNNYQIESHVDASAFHREAETLAEVLDQLARLQTYVAHAISIQHIGTMVDAGLEDVRSELGAHITALREAVDEYRETQHEKIERSHIVRQQL